LQVGDASEGRLTLSDSMPEELAEGAMLAAKGHEEELASLSALPEPSMSFAELQQRKSYRDREVCELPMAFPEIDGENGTYVQMREVGERKRVMMAMLSVLWLRGNAYDAFVSGQSVTMPQNLWRKWQKFVRWADLTRETCHALLVFLAIRGLGKIANNAKFNREGQELNGEENAVLYIMDEMPEAVPSAQQLDADSIELLLETFKVYSRFNLAQMLQGENAPGQIFALKTSVAGASDGTKLLKFYLFALVGVMCGIRGVESFADDSDEILSGSLFMDGTNAQNMLLCINCLQHLEKAEPQSIYWSYIRERALALKLPMLTPEDLAFARIVCLTRTTEEHMLRDVTRAWNHLAPEDKPVLIDHLLADGIDEPAIIFEYLPNLLANCRRNTILGLHSGLCLLVNFVRMCHARLSTELAARKMAMVNLSDVAIFADKVRNAHAFEVVSWHSRLERAQGEMGHFTVTVSSKHWHSVTTEHWEDDIIQEIHRTLQRVERKTVRLLEEKAVGQRRTTQRNDLIAHQELVRERSQTGQQYPAPPQTISAI